MNRIESRLRSHKLGIKLYRIVPELLRRHRFEAVASLRQVRVSLYPLETVHVDARSALELAIQIFPEADLMVHVETVEASASLDEREIERVAIVRCYNGGFGLLNMLEPSSDDGFFVWFVEDGEGALKFGRRGVLEVRNVLRDNVAVVDEVSLTVDHVRDQHDLVKVLIRELERGLCNFDIVRHNHGFRTFDSLFNQFDFNSRFGRRNNVP